MDVCKSRLRHPIPAGPIVGRSGFVCKGLPGTDGSPATPAPGTVDAPEPAPPEEKPLRCAQCLAPVAHERDRCQVAGAQRHVFANPHGYVFEIGCFSRAPGCAAMGPSTPDFSWFPGTRWQVAVCARCGLHLGWRYEGHPEGPFHGLILPRLVASPDHD